jgi:chemotaxis-related protein WspD
MEIPGSIPETGTPGDLGFAQTAGEDCWNRIGVFGDRSCPELLKYTHCRECPVFAAAARRFFERPSARGYLDEWSGRLAAAIGGDARALQERDGGESPLARRDGIGVLVFRLGRQWLAFGARCVDEVTTVRPVHRIPHRSNPVCMGLVSLRGQLRVCVSLHVLLGMEHLESWARLIVIQEGLRGEAWAFPADEVAGVHHVRSDESGSTPRAPVLAFSETTLSWNAHAVFLLDEERVFSAVRSFLT